MVTYGRSIVQIAAHLVRFLDLPGRYTTRSSTSQFQGEGFLRRPRLLGDASNVCLGARVLAIGANWIVGQHCRDRLRSPV